MRDGRMGMAVNVDQRFLGDSQNCDGGRLIHICRVPGRIEIRFDSRPPSKTRRQCLDGRPKRPISQFRRIMQEGKRPELLVYATHRVLNVVEQSVMGGVRIGAPEVRDTQLQSNHQLARGIVEFLAEPLSLILMDPKNLIQHR